jgi:DNA-binding NarL/FixJ family response regulator
MASDPIKVLIIDDSEVDRYTYRRYLQLASPRYQVYEAEDRLEGVNLARTIDPDCVILDLHFPLDSGLEILQELVGTDDQRRRQVIILSGSSDASLQSSSISSGACKYLVKTDTTAHVLDQAIQEAMISVV